MSDIALEQRRSLADRLLGHARLERPVTRLATSLIDGFSGDAHKTFFEPAEFAWIAPIEAEWRAIRAELDRVMADIDRVPGFEELSSSQGHITRDKRWKTYFFRTFSSWAAANCAACPDTTRLLRTIPGLQTAFFSIFEAGKHLPEHCGLYKGVLRYHLGLIVPEPADQCAIRVGAETRHWAEGKSLVFDDSHPHEAWNHTDSPRVVLFLDFERPLPPPVALVNRLAVAVQSRTAYVAELRANQDKTARPG